jgi:hypothetical protein
VVVKTEEVKVEEWRTRFWGLAWGRGKREEEEEGKKKKNKKKKRWHPKILIWLQGRRVKEVARAAVPALPRSDRSGSRSRSGMPLPFGRGVCTFCFFSPCLIPWECGRRVSGFVRLRILNVFFSLGIQPEA